MTAIDGVVAEVLKVIKTESICFWELAQTKAAVMDFQQESGSAL
jgi:hypothetical protein